MSNLKVEIDFDFSSFTPKNFTGIAKTPDRTKYWFKNGLFHREDGPAIEWINGEKEWYKDGKRHREDGPAIEYNTHKAWWINGTKLTEEQHEIIMIFSKESREKLYKNDNRGLKNLLNSAYKS